jgi:hypothetical protein
MDCRDRVRGPASAIQRRCGVDRLLSDLGIREEASLYRWDRREVLRVRPVGSLDSIRQAFGDRVADIIIEA